MSEPNYRWLKKWGPVTSIPFLILFSIGIGIGSGMWLDGKLHTTPWLTIVLTIIGLAAGLYESAKLLIDATRED